MSKAFLKICYLLAVFVAVISLSPLALAASEPVDVIPNDLCTKAPDSTVCKQEKAATHADGTGKNPVFGPDGAVTYAINFMTALVAIAAVIMILYAAIRYITSGNDPQDVNKSREMIIYALVGVVIAGMAQLLVKVFLNKIGTS